MEFMASWRWVLQSLGSHHPSAPLAQTGGPKLLYALFKCMLSDSCLWYNDAGRRSQCQSWEHPLRHAEVPRWWVVVASDLSELSHTSNFISIETAALIQTKQQKLADITAKMGSVAYVRSFLLSSMPSETAKLSKASGSFANYGAGVGPANLLLRLMLTFFLLHNRLDTMPSYSKKPLTQWHQALTNSK